MGKAGFACENDFAAVIEFGVEAGPEEVFRDSGREWVHRVTFGIVQWLGLRWVGRLMVFRSGDFCCSCGFQARSETVP